MRIVVVGTSGAGKSHFAQALAQARGCSHIELDALFWDADWTPQPTPAFLARIDAATTGAQWVADGNYSVARTLLWGRATHIVWLDYGRGRVLWRVFSRTLRRALRREALWAGNTESLKRAFFSRQSILLWAMTTWRKNRVKYAALQADPAYGHLRWQRFTAPRQASDFLAAQPGPDHRPQGAE